MWTCVHRVRMSRAVSAGLALGLVGASLLIQPSTVWAAGQLIVSLPLDEISGNTALDVSGNGNNGSLLNGPVWTSGKWAGALSFDGVNDTLFINDSTSLDVSASGITVSAWVYRRTNAGHWVSVVSRQVGAGFYEHFYLGFSPTGRYAWFVNTTNGYSNAGIGGVAPLGQWVHVVGTYDGSFVRLYVNGIEQFSTPHTGALAADSTGITIGASHNDAAHTPTETLDGKIDELRIYKGALTAQEVAALYQATGGPALDNPPTVSIASPPAGAVKGTITASATAFDDVGIVGIQFMVDGDNNGPEDVTEPYTTIIDTTAYTEGQHALSAVARDAAGNVTVSAPVNVVFDNVAVMPLGDSLTHGIISLDSPNNDDGGYRRYLWERLRAAGITDMNFVGSLKTGIPTIDRDHEGHGGFRIDQLTDSVDVWIPAALPDIILLLIGTNDLIQGATPTVTLSRLSALLDRIHSLRPAAKIILATQPGVTPSNGFGLNPQDLVDYNAGMPALVSNRASQGWSIQLLDMYNLAGLDRSNGSSDYGPDGLHFSLTGYSKLAEVWYSVLDPAVSSDTTPPTIPTGLSAIAVSSSNVDLSWNASVDDVAVAVYRVYRDGVGIATPASTSYQDTGLVANTTYSYTVTALDFANNESAPSAAAAATTGAPPPGDTTPPGVPTGLTATAVSSTSIGLSWTGSTDGGPAVSVTDGFNRANGALGATWTALSGTFQIVSQHVEPAAAATYTTARLTTWAGSGDQWAEVAMTVTGLNSGGGPLVRVGNGGNDLYLVDYNARAAHTLYRVLGGVGAVLGGWTDPAAAGDVVRLEATGATIRVLVNGVVKLTVQNAEVTGGVPGVYAFAAAGEQVQLDTFGAASVGVAGYRVYRNGSAIATTTGTTYADTGLQPATAYSYTVTAFDAAGNESGPSGAASATTLTATATAPPIMALPFEEGTGTVAGDVSGHGNNGTLLNGPTWTTGVTGGGLQFDGSNDVVVVPSSASLNTVTSALTVAAWVYRGANQGRWVSVVSRQVGTSFFEHFYLGFNDTNQYRWFVRTPNGYSNATLGGAAALGQWVHLVGTYDGVTVKLYVNGVQAFSTAHTGALPSDTTGLAIGASFNDAAQTPSEGFNGRVDTVQVYPTALSATDVQTLYSN